MAGPALVLCIGQVVVLLNTFLWDSLGHCIVDNRDSGDRLGLVMGMIRTLENTVHPLLSFHCKKQVACHQSIPKAGHLLIIPFSGYLSGLS